MSRATSGQSTARSEEVIDERRAMRADDRKIGVDDCCIIHLIVNAWHPLARTFLRVRPGFMRGAFLCSARKTPHENEKNCLATASARLQPAHQQIKALLC